MGRVKKDALVIFLLGSAILFCSCLLPQLVGAQKVVDTITGLSMPFQVAVNPKGTYAYATSGGTGSVWVIDTTTNTVTAKITGGNDPFAMDFTPNGKYLYITNGGNDSVWVVDTTTNTVIKTIRVGNGPHGLAITPDGDYAYVTNFGSHTVTIINTALNRAVGTINVGNYPQGIAFTPDGKCAYVANFGLGTVSVINTTTTTVIATIHTGAGPIDVKISPDSKYAYVSESGSGSIAVIDTTTNTISTTISGFLQPLHITITSDGATAYVANGSGDWISVIDLATNKITGKITVGDGPYGMALTPDDAYAYVVNFYGPSVSVVNLGKTTNPNNTTQAIPTPTPFVNRFALPAFGGNINFVVNNTFANATLKDDKWVFEDLYIANSGLFECFEVLAQNTDLTIFSCTMVWALEFQSIRLDYTVAGAGKQVLNFGPRPEEGGRVEWRVICNDIVLTQDRDWSVSDTNETITINSAAGELRVIRYYFSDSFDEPELMFFEQHYVSITIGAGLAALLSIMVLIKVRTKESGEADR